MAFYGPGMNNRRFGDPVCWLYTLEIYPIGFNKVGSKFIEIAYILTFIHHIVSLVPFEFNILVLPMGMTGFDTYKA